MTFLLNNTSSCENIQQQNTLIAYVRKLIILWYELLVHTKHFQKKVIKSIEMIKCIYKENEKTM